jgi:hypothetical protein
LQAVPRAFPPEIPLDTIGISGIIADMDAMTPTQEAAMNHVPGPCRHKIVRILSNGRFVCTGCFGEFKHQPKKATIIGPQRQEG